MFSLETFIASYVDYIASYRISVLPVSLNFLLGTITLLCHTDKSTMPAKVVLVAPAKKVDPVVRQVSAFEHFIVSSYFAQARNQTGTLSCCLVYMLQDCGRRGGSVISDNVKAEYLLRCSGPRCNRVRSIRCDSNGAGKRHLRL